MGDNLQHLDFTNGRVKHSNKVLDFHAVKVGNIYRVNLFVKNIGTLLTKLTEKEEEALKAQ